MQSGSLNELDIKGLKEATSSDDTFQIETAKKKQSHIQRKKKRYFSKYLRSSFFVSWPALVSTLAINILGLCLPLSILQVYDRIIPNQSYETLAFMIAGLVVVILLEASIKIARGFLLVWEASKDGYITEYNSIRNLLFCRPEKIMKEPLIVWSNRFEALKKLENYNASQLRLIFLDLPFSIIFLSVIYMISGNLVLVPIALVMGFSIICILQAKKLKSLLQEDSDLAEKKYDLFVECLNGIQTVKSMSFESAMLRRFERLQESFALNSYNLILTGDAQQRVGSIFANVMILSLVTIGAVFCIQGHLSIGELACCTLLSGRLIQPIIKGFSAWTELQNISVAREVMRPLLDLPNYEEDKLTDIANQGSVQGSLSIQNLSYYVGEERKAVLKDINISVSPGEVIALSGPSGAGKSSLLKLIYGEKEGYEGNIYIGGTNLSTCDVSCLITYIGSKPVIFNGSILDNITMFQKGHVIDEARKASQFVGLERDVNLMPSGYDTVVGDKITNQLSLGIQQKIVIARGLTRKLPILILDEVDIGLDMQSGQELENAIHKLKGEKTILITSNRPSLLRLADRVYLFEEGKVIEEKNNSSDVGLMPPNKASVRKPV